MGAVSGDAAPVAADTSRLWRDAPSIREVRSVLFEPTPIEPARSARGRLRAIVAIAAPLVALVTVVGISVAATGHDAPTQAVEPVVRPVTTALLSAPPAAAPTPAPSQFITWVTAVRFPQQVADIPTTSAAVAMDQRRRGVVGTDATLAVRGWVTMRPLDPRCSAAIGKPDPLAGPCLLTGILRDDPSWSLEWLDGAVSELGSAGNQIRPQVAPEVALHGIDDAFLADPAGGTASGAITPIPVVLVGQFDGAMDAACMENGWYCSNAFDVQRVAWVDGAWQPDAPAP